VIENLDNDPTLNQIKQYFSNITFNSMIVVPIYLGPEHLYGVLVIRMPNNRNTILDEELRFSQIIAQCLSLAIKLHQHSAIEQAS
jgi:GAF domain-containing protein